MSTFARNIRDTRYEEGRTQIVFQKLGVGDIIGQYGVLDQRQHLYEIYVASDSCVYYQLSESVIRSRYIYIYIYLYSRIGHKQWKFL